MDTNSKEYLNELLQKTKDLRQGRRSTLPGRVDLFIRNLGIQAGDTRVPNYVIYYTYRRVWMPSLWEASSDRNINKRHFFKIFSRMFPSGRVGSHRFYLLNPEPFDLSREGKLKAKHYDKKKEREISESKKRTKSKRKT